MTEQKLETAAQKQLRLRTEIIEKELFPNERISLLSANERMPLIEENRNGTELLLCYKTEVPCSFSFSSSFSSVFTSSYAIGDYRTDWKEALKNCRVKAKAREDGQKANDAALLANPCDE